MDGTIPREPNELDTVPVMNEPDTSIERAESGSYGFKLVGDNLDISVNVRYIRSDGHQNQSLHFFHSIAVLDRIDFSALSTQPQATCKNCPLNMALSIVPSTQNDTNLLHNIAIHISRVLVTYMSFFQFAFSDVTTWHIQHRFYQEMSRKSEVVSLQIQNNFELQ